MYIKINEKEPQLEFSIETEEFNANMSLQGVSAEDMPGLFIPMLVAGAIVIIICVVAPSYIRNNRKFKEVKEKQETERMKIQRSIDDRKEREKWNQ